MKRHIEPVDFSDRDAQLVRDSFSRISAQLVPISADFYERLFEAEPQLRQMFSPEIGPQLSKLAHTLSHAIAALDKRNGLHDELQNLGRAHRGLGVRARHYPMVMDALIEALAAAFGQDWTQEIEIAWRRLLGFVASTMLQGSRLARANVSPRDSARADRLRPC